MFRSGSVVTMGKEHDHSVLLQPLCFSRGDEVVDDDLSSIVEISKLSFPNGQRLWAIDGISVFVGKNGKFGQWRIDGLESSLLG